MAAGVLALLVVHPVPEDFLADAYVVASCFDEVLVALLQAPPQVLRQLLHPQLLVGGGAGPLPLQHNPMRRWRRRRSPIPNG